MKHNYNNKVYFIQNDPILLSYEYKDIKNFLLSKISQNVKKILPKIDIKDFFIFCGHYSTPLSIKYKEPAYLNQNIT